MSDNQLATVPPEQRTVKDWLALPAYRDRFHEVLKHRAPQFMAAITASSNLPALKDAEPLSVIAAAMVAATLDLPINPTLGMAHIVAYGDGQGRKVAQFQCGYKGFIQLALRSGQYKRLNAGPVSGSVFKGYDIVGEPVLDWTGFDPLAEVTGYFCAFETLNGFTKVIYWTKAQCEAHAKRFSKAYAKGYSTPWKSDFDSMATKTVIKAALTKWGIMSVEMQKVATHDQGAQADVDAEVKYVDGEDKTVEDQVPGDPVPVRPEPPARKARGSKAVVQEAQVVTEVKATEAPAQTQQTAPAVEQKPVDDAKAKAAELKADDSAATPSQQTTTQQAAPLPRAFLQDKETLDTIIVVKDSGALAITVGGVPHPSVSADVTGGFVGRIYHKGGGILVENKPTVPEMWKPGSRLRVSLTGILNNKVKNDDGTFGKVQVIVNKAVVEAESEGMEMEG